MKEKTCDRLRHPENENAEDVMKRDLDLMRELLKGIEDRDDMDGTREWHDYEPSDLGIDGHSKKEVNYHLNILIEAGFIDGGITAFTPVIRRLTWNGHEFLDATRDDTFWKKAKDTIISKAIPFSAEAVMKVLNPMLIELYKSMGIA